MNTSKFTGEEKHFTGKVKKDQIQNISLDNPCRIFNLKLNSCGQDYYCDVCNKTVIDFRNKTKQELEKEVLQTTNYVCGIFDKQQVSNRRRIPKILASIILTLGLNLIFKDIKAQNFDTLSNVNEKIVHEDLIIGTFEIFPMFKDGGQEGLEKFLQENLTFPDSLNKSGKVIIKLSIDTAGIVTNIKLVKGFNEYADKEALRVCSLLVFTPGYVYGKPVETKILIPIKFNLPVGREKSNR